MKPPTNKERAALAKSAVARYVELSGTNEEDFGVHLTDLLCDLRHLCDQTDVSFASCHAGSVCHYSEEVEWEGKPGPIERLLNNLEDN